MVRHLKTHEPIKLTPASSTSRSSGGRRDARSQSLQGVRITVSDADLNDAAKYCSASGQTRPDFTGATVICRSEDILTSTKRTLLTKTILPAAIARIQSVLLLEPTASPIIVPATACAGLDITIPASHSTAGVADSDYVLLVTAGRTAQGTLAFAGPCVTADTGRIVVGRVNFGPSSLVWSSTDHIANEELIVTAVHEIFHALGFSYSVFNDAGMVTIVPRRQGATVYVFNGTRARDAAREFFDCPSMDGVELEGEGGSGARLSHVDKRLLADDIMAATGGNLLSKIAVAMLADLGHYTPASASITTTSTTTTAAAFQNMSFGYRGGCPFINSKCVFSDGVFGNTKFFCFDATVVDDCSFDYTYSGECGIAVGLEALPAAFRYFAGSPNKGGTDAYMDGCPRLDALSNRFCNEERHATFSEYAYGYTFSRYSRCFKTNAVLRNGFTVASALLGSTRCLVSRCQTDPATQKLYVQFQINGSNWVDCKTEGEAISSLPNNYAGQVQCPASFSTFCAWYDRVPLKPGPQVVFLNRTASSDEESFFSVGVIVGLICGGVAVLFVLVLIITKCSNNAAEGEEATAGAAGAAPASGGGGGGGAPVSSIGSPGDGSFKRGTALRSYPRDVHQGLVEPKDVHHGHTAVRNPLSGPKTVESDDD